MIPASALIAIPTLVVITVATSIGYRRMLARSHDRELSLMRDLNDQTSKLTEVTGTLNRTTANLEWAIARIKELEGQATTCPVCEHNAAVRNGFWTGP